MVIFSVYDSGYRSSALLLNDGMLAVDDTYFEKLKYAGDVPYFEDEKLFDYFSKLFPNEPIHEIIVMEDGEVCKVRYEGKYFAKEYKYFGYDTTADGYLEPYVSTIIKKEVVK